VATQTYPGGLTATYGYDEAGAASLSYAGASWTAPLTDTVTPNAHGDWAAQAIADTGQPLSDTQAYSYDNADRITGVQDALAGQCTTRTYVYNANSDRTSLATAAPASGGSCQTSGPTTKTWSYDSADRVTNSGYTYDTQGDITTTPSADAGGSGNLTATYFANDMLHSQAQNGTTLTWTLDPQANRFATWVNSRTGVTDTNHYSDTSSDPAWVSGSDGTWTRYVTDLLGSLAAQVTASGVTLELPDLHGDIIAAAAAGSSSTGPASTTVYTEFGSPESGTGGGYGWLGGDQISGNALGGQLLMGVRVYNPGTGRFDQVDPINGSSANAYDYGDQNPIAHVDLTGEDWRLVSTVSWWLTPWLPFESELPPIVRDWIHDLLNFLKIFVVSFDVIDPQYRIKVEDRVYRWYTAKGKKGKATNKWTDEVWGLEYVKGEWAVKVFGITVYHGHWGPWLLYEEFWGDVNYTSNHPIYYS
jgi:RHS repeat-associated protein